MAITFVRAVDTNIVVRTITLDGGDQARVAEQEMSDGTVLITKSVFLEIEWVLRSSYKWSRKRINDSLHQLLQFENLVFEDESALAFAVERHAEGRDLADMIHLMSARGASEFVTFDRRLSKIETDGAPPIRLA
jgi:predicted nucleic-acid-binding protein